MLRAPSNEVVGMSWAGCDGPGDREFGERPVFELGSGDTGWETL